MDELAKKLSAISFAVIGVICLIGVYQKRGWLEMFTIGGSFFLSLLVESKLIFAFESSFIGSSSYSRRITNRSNCDSSTGSLENVET